QPEGPAKPGRSFVSALEGAASPEDRDVVVFDEYGPVRMVRTRNWKYVHRHPEGPHELFDLVSDPDERTSRIDDPSLHNVVAMLRGRLTNWFAAYVDPVRDGLNKGITGCGQ